MDISKFIQNKGLTEIEIEVLNYMIDNINDINKMGVRGVAKIILHQHLLLWD